jgi:uncharacterized lipoprotein YmbA
MRLFMIGSALLMAACDQQEQRHAAQVPNAPDIPALSAGQSKAALMIAIPKDPDALRKLVKMGYTMHEDHLHAPGVTSCPKMSENPVR